ncbi:MAG: bifunctional metallophosphatase/5'-nucleotidase [Candidatus Eremiobacteraeota bacterium]|nr:bifunctional metallophosphatase/5'-nucleotidase [Candidatus Eremiobacteraeota bacterium]
MSRFIRIDGAAPRDIYLRGKGVFDLSRLREKPVKGPKEGELLEEGKHPEQAGGEVPAETSVFHSDMEHIQEEMSGTAKTPDKETFDDEASAGIERELPHRRDNFKESLSEYREPVTLTIMHTNDLHGNLLPREDFTDFRNPDTKIKIGGGPAIATVIKEERRKAGEQGEHFLLVDSGDIAMGTSISGMFEGKPVIEVMNKEGYDAATIGNHDFDWGVPALNNMIQEADFPFLAANISDEYGKPLPDVQPFIIKDMPGLKVGIVGVANEETKSLNVRDDVRKLNFHDPIDSLKATIPEMKRQGADMIVVLSHTGLEKDREIAENVKGIDLIVGGHSHDTLSKPVKVGKTMIVQTGFGGRNIGKVQLKWDPNEKKVIAGDGHLIPIDADKINADTGIMGIIDKYKSKLDSIMNVKIGESKADMIQPHSGKETNLGNLITDLMREKTGADIAMLNSGNIRTNLFKGEIKFKDIYNILPFDSKIVTLNMMGSDIIDALEESSGRTEEDKTLQISGLKVVYDSSRPAGERLKEVRTPDGKILDPDRGYKVAATDYLVKGGDSYAEFTNGDEVEYNDEVMYETVAEQIRTMGIVGNNDLGRMEDLGMEV